MKKITSLLLVVMLMATMFVACSNEPASDVTVPSETVEKVAGDEAEDKNEKEEAVVEDANVPNADGFMGYLWEVEKDGKKVHLFGSIHIASPSMFPFNEVVENLYDNADVLAVEADISDVPSIQALIPQMMYEGDDTVYNHLSAENIKTYEAACEEMGLSPKLLEKYKVWAVGSNILSLQLMNSGYAGTTGVDMYFLQKANASGKTIEELEGAQFQFDMFNNFTDEEQEAAFFNSLGTIEETVADFEKLYNAFVSGDAKELEASLTSEEGEVDPVAESVNTQMLHDRNVGMADKIEEYLASDKSYFVVAGVAHYIGDDSVIKMLEERGYTVKQTTK